MKTAIATLEGVSTYSQSRYHDTPKLEKELADAYEKRTWREKAHVNKDGFMFMPPISFKTCIAEGAKHLSIQIPGKAKQTYTKNFRSGILVTDGLVLPIKKDEMKSETVPCGAQGAGSNKIVIKTFPIVHEWCGDVTFYILDETITEDVFTRVLKEAGTLIGIGRSRPSSPSGYFYGRFKVNDIKWS